MPWLETNKPMIPFVPITCEGTTTPTLCRGGREQVARTINFLTNMKAVYIILVIVGMTSCKTSKEKSSFGAKNVLLNIQTLKQEYYAKDTITITVENRSKKKMYYCMALERLKNGHWDEIDNDIIYNEEKAAKIEEIDMISKIYKYDVKQIDSVYFEGNIGLFRIKMVYGVSLERLVDSRAREVVSVPFKIILTE